MALYKRITDPDGITAQYWKVKSVYARESAQSFYPTDIIIEGYKTESSRQKHSKPKTCINVTILANDIAPVGTAPGT